MRSGQGRETRTVERRTARERTTDASGPLSLHLSESADDIRLIAGIRRADPAALHEFIARFTPLLRGHARRLRVPAGECATFVATFLDDMALRIAAGAQPRHLLSYLVRSLRNEVFATVRAANAEERNVELRTEDLGDARVVAGACSEYTIHALVPPAVEVVAQSAREVALVRLTVYLSYEMSESDQILVTWLANHVPARQIAAWLGISYEATRVRISRVRARLREEALRYRGGLTADERRELDPFFRRVGLLDGSDEPLPENGAGADHD